MPNIKPNPSNIQSRQRDFLLLLSSAFQISNQHILVSFVAKNLVYQFFIRKNLATLLALLDSFLAFQSIYLTHLNFFG